MSKTCEVSEEEAKKAYIEKIKEAEKTIEENRKKLAELEKLASEFHINLRELAKKYIL